MASGASGTRTVITSVIIFKGGVSGVGRIVEVDNLLDEPDNVTRDDLVFANGTVHIVNTNLGFSISVNPHSCMATATLPQSNEIVGGTGQFTHATGHFTGTVTGRAVLARNPDRGCDLDLSRDPLHEVDMIAATGTLSF